MNTQSRELCDAGRQSTLMLGLTPDGFFAKDHPLQRIKALVDSVPARMSPLFHELYASAGLPSILPRHLCKLFPLMPFYLLPVTRVGPRPAEATVPATSRSRAAAARGRSRPPIRRRTQIARDPSKRPGPA